METPEPSTEVIVDLGLYTQTAILKATYKFTGNYFVRLEKVSDNSLTVAFTVKSPAILTANLTEEFLNELLDQRLREHISVETLPVRNLIMAHALSKLDLVPPADSGINSPHDSNNLPADQ